MARIDAARSCLIDPKEGALNVAVTDRIIPADGWVRFSNIWQSVVTINMNLLNLGEKPGEHVRLGDHQRMLLSIRWDDDQRRELAFGYEVIEKGAVMTASEHPAGAGQ